MSSLKIEKEIKLREEEGLIITSDLKKLNIHIIYINETFYVNGVPLQKIIQLKEEMDAIKAMKNHLKKS